MFCKMKMLLQMTRIRRKNALILSIAVCTVILLLYLVINHSIPDKFVSCILRNYRYEIIITTFPLSFQDNLKIIENKLKIIENGLYQNHADVYEIKQKIDTIENSNNKLVQQNSVEKKTYDTSSNRIEEIIVSQRECSANTNTPPNTDIQVLLYFDLNTFFIKNVIPLIS